MKNTLKILPSVLLLSIVHLNCKKETNPLTEIVSVRIIGVDPCTARYTTGTPQKGYVLLNNDSKDTLVTYNLPLAIAKQVDASFKLKNNYLFTDETIFRTNLSYRKAAENERVNVLCNAMINIAGFDSTNQIIIIENNASAPN